MAMNFTCKKRIDQTVTTVMRWQDDASVGLEDVSRVMESDDVRYFTMKTALRNLQEKPEDVNLSNTFKILESLSMPSHADNSTTLSNFSTSEPELKTNKKLSSYHEQKRLFTQLWLEFLQQKLPSNVYKSVLAVLHEKVMPCMTSPLQLSDFLTRSYNIGGVISLLALNGLFILIHSYNLDYPNFYEKLYTLLSPSVFHVKYRARFFFLLDMFLTSTHIPAYLMAAYVKRLARMALTAPPQALVSVIPLIYNLIHRHPNCKVLLHRTDGPSDLTSDPFNMDEANPEKCQALESSLWELKTLSNHYYHSLAYEASKIDQPLQKQEIDVSELLGTSIDDLVAKERKKKLKEVATNFVAPEKLLTPNSGLGLWLLE